MANTWDEECAANWGAYREKLRYSHTVLYGRREKIDFNLKLIKKGLLCGRDCVHKHVHWICNNQPRYSNLTDDIGWGTGSETFPEAAVRIFKDGVDKFFERNRPCFFYPSTEKLAKFLITYCIDNMPVKIPPELEEMDRDSVKEEYNWWYNVADWRNNAIEQFVEIVCKKYKKHVPLFCRAKFPEWAVKWVYEETVRMKQEED